MESQNIQAAEAALQSKEPHTRTPSSYEPMQALTGSINYPCIFLRAANGLPILGHLTPKRRICRGMHRACRHVASLHTQTACTVKKYTEPCTKANWAAACHKANTCSSPESMRATPVEALPCHAPTPTPSIVAWDAARLRKRRAKSSNIWAQVNNYTPMGVVSPSSTALLHKCQSYTASIHP